MKNPRSTSKPNDPEAARQYCLNLLSGRPRTRTELGDSMRRKGFEEEIVTEILERYAEVGLIERRIASGEIEIAPIAFMRGRTLANAFIILDEAQNTTPMQMKMFLTRFGENSRMVICGDPRQVDLPDPGKSGLADAVAKLKGIQGISVVPFNAADVVRHPIVGKIVQAYEGPDA